MPLFETPVRHHQAYHHLHYLVLFPLSLLLTAFLTNLAMNIPVYLSIDRTSSIDALIPPGCEPTWLHYPDCSAVLGAPSLFPTLFQPKPVVTSLFRAKLPCWGPGKAVARHPPAAALPVDKIYELYVNCKELLSMDTEGYPPKWWDAEIGRPVFLPESREWKKVMDQKITTPHYKNCTCELREAVEEAVDQLLSVHPKPIKHSANTCPCGLEQAWKPYRFLAGNFTFFPYPHFRTLMNQPAKSAEEEIKDGFEQPMDDRAINIKKKSQTHHLPPQKVHLFWADPSTLIGNTSVIHSTSQVSLAWQLLWSTLFPAAHTNEQKYDEPTLFTLFGLHLWQWAIDPATVPTLHNNGEIPWNDMDLLEVIEDNKQALSREEKRAFVKGGWLETKDFDLGDLD